MKRAILHVKKPKHQKRKIKRAQKQYGTTNIDIIRKKVLERDSIVHDSKERGFDEDLPGGGRFFCEPCDRHFIDQKVLDEHKKTKSHKRRVKELKEIPYSVKESEACAGLF